MLPVTLPADPNQIVEIAVASVLVFMVDLELIDLVPVSIAP